MAKNGKHANGRQEDFKLTLPITIYASPELKRLAGERADQDGIPLSELAARALAVYIGKPDLGKIPRKPLGRPRNPVVAS